MRKKRNILLIFILLYINSNIKLNIWKIIANLKSLLNLFNMYISIWFSYFDAHNTLDIYSIVFDD